MVDLNWREIVTCAAIGVLAAIVLILALKFAPLHGDPKNCVVVGGALNFGGC